ncbi:tyrosine-type recombinase/integrase [Vibrio harveyi]|uniref:tyrosine-type recombinase/integrase n=1 Tax=Vibrio harveyi TaxID=669 RepID=UPI000346622F|nr:site-specific integrase [Vibrio harveyi]GEA22336.1 recombinase [Vibrio harveyi]
MSTLSLNLSEAVIKKHMPNREVTEINDPRHPLRFRYNSARTGGSWFYVRGKRWKKIGEYPLVKFSLVVAKLPEIEINLMSGLDIDSAVTGHFSTVSDLLRWYVDRVGNKRGLSQTRKQGVKTAVNRYLMPRLGGVWMADVTKPVIDSRLMMAMQHDYALSTIQLAFGVLKTAFRQAHSSGHIDVNPLDDMTYSDFISESIEPKPAALTPHSLVTVIERSISLVGSDSLLVALMGLHGTRIGETRLAHWSEFNLNEMVWSIPAHKTKNKKPLKVPLTSQTVQMLERYKQSQLERGYRGVWLFRGSKKSPFTPKQANDAVKRWSGGEWTAHDLRKAYRDVHNEIGTEYLLAERLINHSLTRLDKTYNQKEQLERAKLATQAAHDWIFSRFKAKTTSRSKTDH